MANSDVPAEMNRPGMPAGAPAGMPADADDDMPPVLPSLKPNEWLRHNLFSSKANTVLTIVGSIIALFAVRGLLNFVFSEERGWDAIRTNIRLLFTQAYPTEQYSRIWVTIGVLVVLAGFTVGMWARWGVVPLKRIAGWLMITGVMIALGVLLREPSVLMGSNGETLRDSANNILRESFGSAMADRWVWWVAAVVLFVLGGAIWQLLGVEGRRTTFVPATFLLGLALAIVIGSMWVVRYGHYSFLNDEVLAAPGELVAASTRIPWSVMWLLLVGAFFVGRALRTSGAISERRQKTLRMFVNIGWLASPFFLYWIVLRDPDFDYSHVFSTDIPMALAFAVVGGAILWWLTKPGLGELGRIAAALLLVPVSISWLSAFFGWFPMLQKARMSLLLLLVVALLAPNFAGDHRQRRRLVAAWVLLILVFHYLITAINADATINTPSREFVGGFGVTLLVATLTLIFAFPLGILLALARTSKLPLFRVTATTFIEVVRGVPLITVLIFFALIVNLFLPDGIEISLLAAVILGFSLFAGAYLAESIRGGLQAVTSGQVEAANALGLTTAQRTLFVVLPQALRVSIPTLVGTVIAVFKETSLLAIIGLFDFLRIANIVVPSQTEFLGIRREGLLFVSAVYWIVTFSMSKYSQRLERQLGVGQR